MIPAPILRSVGEVLKSMLPGLGFALLVFEFGEKGKQADYISNANREDMIKALRETADRLEKRKDYQTPSN